MQYTLQQTSGFKKSLKKMKKRGKDLAKLGAVVDKIMAGETLEPKYRNHKLEDDGGRKNCWECHIEPDWLLVYRKEREQLILLLLETGTHSDLFGK